MPVMDEFKEERESLKHGTLKEKFSYFMDYYKWPVVAVIAVTAFVISILYHMIFQKNDALFVVLLNTQSTDVSEEYIQRFAEYADINMGSYNIVFDTTMQTASSAGAFPDVNAIATSQKLMAYVAGKELDVLVANVSVTNTYAYNGAFFDLRDFLSEEQYKEYEPYFYYMDRAVAEERDAAMTSYEDSAVLPDYPSPRNPETMKDPVPVGIYLDDVDSLKEAYHFADDDAILSVLVNTRRMENASKLIDFIFRQNP